MTEASLTSCVRGACVLVLCAGLAALSGCGNGTPDGAGAPAPLAKLSTDAGAAVNRTAATAFAETGEGIAYWQLNDGEGNRTMYATYDPVTGWSPESELDLPRFTRGTFVAGRTGILMYWEERASGEDRAWARIFRNGRWSDSVLLAAGLYTQHIEAASPLDDGFQVLLVRSSERVFPGNGNAPLPTPGPSLFVYDAGGWHAAVPLPEPPSTGSPLYYLRDPRWVFSDVEEDDQFQGVRLLVATGDAGTAGDWTVVAERTDGTNFLGYAEACGAGVLAVWWDWDATGTVWRRHARRYMNGAGGATLDLGELPIGQAGSSLVYPIVPRMVPGPAGCLLQFVTFDGAHLQLTAEVFSDTGSQRRVLVENLDDGGGLFPLGNRDGYVVWWTEEVPQGNGTRLRTLHADVFQDGAWVGDHVVDSHEISGPYEDFFKLLLAPHGHGAAVRTPDGDVVAHLFRDGIWLAPTVLARQQPSLDLALGGDGDAVAAVWVDTGTEPANTDVRTSRFADGTWDAPQSLLRQPHPCSQGDPLATVTPGRRVVVVWAVTCTLGLDNRGQRIIGEARYAVRDGNGTWSDPEPVPFSDKSATSLVAAGENVFLIQPGSDGIVANALKAGGPGETVRLTPEGVDLARGFVDMIEPFAARAEGNRLAVVWAQRPLPVGDDPYAIFANVFDGTAWSGPVPLGVDAGAVQLAAHVFSGSGLTAVWGENQPGGGPCAAYARTDNGQGWGDAVRLMEGAAYECGRVELVANDRGYLAWWFEPDGAGGRRLRGRRLVDGRWGDPVTLVPASREPDDPVMVAGTGKTFLLVANTSDAGAGSVIARRFNGANWADVPGIRVEPGSGLTELHVTPGDRGYLVWWWDPTRSIRYPSYIQVLDGAAWGEVLNLAELGYQGAWLAVADGNGFAMPIVNTGVPDRTFAVRYRFGAGWGRLEPLPEGEEGLGLPELVVRDGANPLAIWSRPDPAGDFDVRQIWAGGF